VAANFPLPSELVDRSEQLCFFCSSALAFLFPSFILLYEQLSSHYRDKILVACCRLGYSSLKMIVTLSSTTILPVPTQAVAELEMIHRLGYYDSALPDYPKNFYPPAATVLNYHEPNRGNAIMGTAIAFTLIMLVLLVVRLVLRTTHRRESLRLDDHWLILGVVSLKPNYSVKDKC
jgi:hypothetical protein